MTFINKLFATRKKLAKSPQTLCEKLFDFDAEQVQVVVFKECDFRGRKLLFDSRSVQRIHCKDAEEALKKSFVEITDGFGYMIGKPDRDLWQLREMVFGSVAMAYKDTIYKIHQMALPSRLVFSQVFQCANMRNSQICASCERHSSRLVDSGIHSDSFGCNSAVSSTHSDTILLCKQRQWQIPSVVTNSSLTSSSGYGEMTDGSINSSPNSIPIDLSSDSGNESTKEKLSLSATNSQEASKKARTKYKLGLAVILHMEPDENKLLENFLMQHAELLESVFWRLRRGVETGFLKHRAFVSIVYEVSRSTAQWFVDFISSPHMKNHLWFQLLNDCDMFFKQPSSIPSSSRKHLVVNVEEKANADFSFAKLCMFFGHECPNDNLAELFMHEFCDLLQKYDSKDTNFSLLTAILTYHLGWVNSVMNREEIPKENPLRKQLHELYGCIGQPKRSAHTVLTGSNENNLIDRIIRILGYFLRCHQLQWRQYEKCSLLSEQVEQICNNNQQIPQKEEKQYAEHVREIISGAQKVSLHKNRSCLGNLCVQNEDCLKSEEKCDDSEKKTVVFVLGENEKLEGIKNNEKKGQVASSSTNNNEKTKADKSSEPKSAKYRYSGVKFNFQQYPQIFENYMKSKNIELPNFMADLKKSDCVQAITNTPVVDFSLYDSNPSDEDLDDVLLQTPSNASELESTNELVVSKQPELVKAKESVHKGKKTVEFVRQHAKNTLVVVEPPNTLNLIEMPMPKYVLCQSGCDFSYSTTLIRGFHENYISNVAVQGVGSSSNIWQASLKKDLMSIAKHPIFDDSNLEESVAIVANTNIWEVQIMSSHTFVINKGSSGVAVGMSQLVANMLETLLHLWRLNIPAKYCLLHIEQKLREFCEQSKALARLLLDTDFCNMETLTTSLKLDINDVPLLLAVASVHTPEVTQKYGISFQ